MSAARGTPTLLPAVGGLLIVVFFAQASRAGAQEEPLFKESGSRAPYHHLIPLYDASGAPIGPDSTAPYSTQQTCGKCHDVERMAAGFHSNPRAWPDGARATEPDFYVDERLGLVLPISVRGEAGTFTPADVGWGWVDYWQALGHHRVEPVRLEGADSLIELDCLGCHLADRSYSIEARAKAIRGGHGAATATVAAGLARLRADDDAPESVVYDPRRFDAEGHVFFDVVRSPLDSSCLACHSDLEVGPNAEPRWRHEVDVHTAAGIACVDCHGAGVDHQMVRGAPGEVHPSGRSVTSGSCRGCHYDEAPNGGRHGAPVPQHRGLPRLHLDRLDCTVCHSGEFPRRSVAEWQTSRAHELGVASQTRTAEDPPSIRGTIHARGADGVIRSSRETYPAYWAWSSGERLTPIAIEDLRRPLRRALRVRRDFATDVASDAETFRAKITAALIALAESPPPSIDDPGSGKPVYVAGGRVWRLAGETVESVPTPAAGPVAWPVAHAVRPARHALGAGGCHECHALDSPFVERDWIVASPAPGLDGDTIAMTERLDLDDWDDWAGLFAGRDRAKALLWVAIILGAWGLWRSAVAGGRR